MQENIPYNFADGEGFCGFCAVFVFPRSFAGGRATGMVVTTRKRRITSNEVPVGAIERRRMDP